MDLVRLIPTPLRRLHYRPGRRLLQLGDRAVWKDPVITGEERLPELEQHIRDRKALIVVANHISFRDFIELTRTLLRIVPATRNRRIIIPLAYHMYRRPYMKWFLCPLAFVSGIHMAPLINPTSRRQLELTKEHYYARRDRYQRNVRQVLSNADILMLAPQAGIKPVLGKPVGKPIATLLDLAGDDPTGVLAIGIGLEGHEDYADPAIRGLNRRRVYTLSFGALVEAEQLKKQASASGVGVDDIVFQHLAEVVPPSYR